MAIEMAAASAVVGVVGVIGGLAGNRKAKRLAKARARSTYLTRMEEIRRERQNQEQILGANIAAVGASNLMFSGTPQRVLNKVRTDFAQDIEWRRTAADLERKGELAAAPGGAQDASVIAAGIGSIAQSFIGYNS